jgi:hypothetical protein
VAKIESPWMVFAEQVPEAQRLNDPKTPPEEKAEIRRAINSSIDIAQSITEHRAAQPARHAENHAERDRVMADWVRGRAGERKRLSELHGVPKTRIKKWMEQLRKPPAAELPADDWRTVAYGQMLSHQNRQSGRRPKKPKG